MTNITLNQVNENLLILKKEVDYIKELLEGSDRGFKPSNRNMFNLLISEKSLAKDWLTKEEDKAWKDL